MVLVNAHLVLLNSEIHALIDVESIKNGMEIHVNVLMDMQELMESADLVLLILLSTLIEILVFVLTEQYLIQILQDASQLFNAHKILPL